MNLVRHAEPDDQETLELLVAHATEELVSRRGGPGLLDAWCGSSDLSDALPLALEHVSRFPHQILLSEWDGAPAGLSIAWVTPHSGWIGIFVDVGARHHGLGPQLCAAGIEWLSDQGCSFIDALSLPGDREMKNLLEKSGFKARLLTLRRDA